MSILLLEIFIIVYTLCYFVNRESGFYQLLSNGNTKAPFLLLNDNEMTWVVFVLLILLLVVLKFIAIIRSESMSSKIATMVLIIVLAIWVFIPILFGLCSSDKVVDDKILRYENEDNQEYEVFELTDEGVKFVSGLITGPYEFAEAKNATFLTAMDIECGESMKYESQCSYIFKVDHRNLLKLFAESDGKGGIINEQVKVHADLVIKDGCLVWINGEEKDAVYLSYNAEKGTLVAVGKESCK